MAANWSKWVMRGFLGLVSLLLVAPAFGPTALLAREPPVPNPVPSIAAIKPIPVKVIVIANFEQGLRYADIKGIGRASLEYAFIPGASLWEKGRIGTAAAPCARSLDDAPCQHFIRDNEKARPQAGLKQDYDRFERVELPRAAQALGQ